jgi:hypothetical protein
MRRPRSESSPSPPHPPEPPHPATDPSHPWAAPPCRGLHTLLLHATLTPRVASSPQAPSAALRPPAAAYTSDPSAAIGLPPCTAILPRVADRPHVRCSPCHLAALAGCGATTRRSCRVATRTAPVPAGRPAAAILAACAQLCASYVLRRRRGGWEGRRGRVEVAARVRPSRPWE